MNKVIRNVSELPGWFDIRFYEHWQNEDLYTAALAIEDKISIKTFLYTGCIVSPSPLADETKNIVLKKFSDFAAMPYRRSWNDIMFAVFHSQDSINHSEDHADFRRMEQEERENIDHAAIVEAKRILGGGFTNEQEEIRRVTVRDVLHWMEDNRNILNEIDASSQRISRENGWDLDKVRRAIESNIPIWSWDGSDFLDVSGYPTIPAELKKIESHLLARAKAERPSESLSARAADVKKLFEYRVAAYFDLLSWSHLVGCTITKKCMANAIFPDGRYGEVDMMPSKTIGGFIKRLENGGISELVAKSAEL